MSTDNQNEEPERLGLADTIYLQIGMPNTQGQLLAGNVMMRELIATLLQLNIITAQQVEDMLARVTERFEDACSFLPSEDAPEVAVKFHADMSAGLKEGAEAVVKKIHERAASVNEVK